MKINTGDLIKQLRSEEMAEAPRASGAAMVGWAGVVRVFRAYLGVSGPASLGFGVYRWAVLFPWWPSSLSLPRAPLALAQRHGSARRVARGARRAPVAALLPALCMETFRGEKDGGSDMRGWRQQPGRKPMPAPPLHRPFWIPQGPRQGTLVSSIRYIRLFVKSYMRLFARVKTRGPCAHDATAAAVAGQALWRHGLGVQQAAGCGQRGARCGRGSEEGGAQKH